MSIDILCFYSRKFDSGGKMKIYITITEEPLYINHFIKDVIQSNFDEIVGINIVSGSFLEGKNLKRKIEYIATIALISGPFQLLKRIFLMGGFFVFDGIKSLKPKNPLSISKVANKYNIPVTYVDNINSDEFLDHLRELDIDLIINQANLILKKELLEVPNIGCINRHSALLPKYRGQLAPFWAYINMEKESGVSIHFLDDKIDNGAIIVQKKVPIDRFDTFDSLMEKIFSITPEAMNEALKIIRNGDFEEKLIENDYKFSSYYSIPRFKDAVNFRIVMLSKWFRGIC